MRLAATKWLGQDRWQQERVLGRGVEVGADEFCVRRKMFCLKIEA